MTRTIYFDPAELGPRNARAGETMTVFYHGRYAAKFRFDGETWVKCLETDSNGQWPKEAP